MKQKLVLVLTLTTSMTLFGMHTEIVPLFAPTPLFDAIKHLRPQDVERLLNEGANVNVEDTDGRTCLHELSFRACIKWIDDVQQEKEDAILAIIETLRKHGVPLHGHHNSTTPFHLLTRIYNKRYICALMVPLHTPLRKKETHKKLFTFLCCLRRLEVTLPRDIKFLLFSHMPIEYTYGELEKIVPLEKTTLRRKFLDECFSQLPAMATQEEADQMQATLNKKGLRCKIRATDFAKDSEIEIKHIVDPETWLQIKK